MVYMKNIHSIENELLLKEKSLLIVKTMQEYNQEREYFEYPRFSTFKSGLYDKNFSPIFSLIQNDIKLFTSGYYIDNGKAYLIVSLPKERYFGANFLVIENEISFASVYEKVLLILVSIIVILFVLSAFFLRSFARPYQKINKQLDNFIKDSMHEINTPLSIINVNIDLYNRKNEPNKYMQRMKAATKVLSNIYNDMDYLIKNDRLEYKRQKIDLALFLQDRVEYFQEVANMKNILIKTDIQKHLYVMMNDKQLQRVIDNNISNAIKYSYENSKIEVGLHNLGSNLYLSFKDYGMGIEKPEEIFTRYYREDASKGGFGIGLNIVKSIIDEYNIKLQIDSIPKQGSRFLYILHQYP